MFLLFFVYLCGDIEICPSPTLVDICKQSGLKIFHQNIRGLGSSYEGIYELLDSNRKIDISTLSETHLSKNLNNQLFNIEGYTFINRSRENGSGGGVVMYLKKSIIWKRRQDLEKSNI